MGFLVAAGKTDRRSKIHATRVTLEPAGLNRRLTKTRRSQSSFTKQKDMKMKRGQLAAWCCTALGVVVGFVLASSTPTAVAQNGNGIGKGGIPGVVAALDDRLAAAEADIAAIGDAVLDLQDAVAANTKRTKINATAIAKINKVNASQDQMILDILAALEECCGDSGCRSDRDCPAGTYCCPDGTCAKSPKLCKAVQHCKVGYYLCNGTCIPKEQASKMQKAAASAVKSN